jgi:hypothetical protein
MELLRAMYASWGHPESAPEAKSLPMTGVIEPGVAAMFMYATDSNLCSLEHAITMKGAPGHTEMIHAMVDVLIEEAKRHGFKRCFVYVGNEHAVKRAIATGFKLSKEPQRWQLEWDLG